jgi:hypothetical protein
MLVYKNEVLHAAPAAAGGVYIKKAAFHPVAHDSHTENWWPF